MHKQAQASRDASQPISPHCFSNSTQAAKQAIPQVAGQRDNVSGRLAEARDLDTAGDNLRCLAFWNVEKAWDWVSVASQPKAMLYVVARLHLHLDMAGKNGPSRTVIRHEFIVPKHTTVL